MEIVTYTDARANLKGLMDDVTGNSTPVILTRQRGAPVVMVSLSDWNAITETMHLLSTPANTARLRKSIAQLEAGKGTERELRKP